MSQMHFQILDKCQTCEIYRDYTSDGFYSSDNILHLRKSISAPLVMLPMGLLSLGVYSNNDKNTAYEPRGTALM